MRKFLRRCWRKTALIPLALVAVLIGTILPASAVNSPYDINYYSLNGCLAHSYLIDQPVGYSAPDSATIVNDIQCQGVYVWTFYCFLLNGACQSYHWGPVGGGWLAPYGISNAAFDAPPYYVLQLGTKVELIMNGTVKCWQDTVWGSPSVVTC